MADKHRVEVEILGQKYTIRTDAPAEYVRELAGHVEQRVKDIRGEGPAQNPVKLLALAAIYITDELFRLRDDHELVDKDTSARLDALNRLLDSVAPPRS
jgi:cell division protein ZapA